MPRSATTFHILTDGNDSLLVEVDAAGHELYYGLSTYPTTYHVLHDGDTSVLIAVDQHGQERYYGLPADLTVLLAQD